MRFLKVTLFACALAILLSTATLAAISITPQPTGVAGVITAIDLVKKTVTVATPPSNTSPSPRSVTFFVTEKTLITRNGTPAKVTDLAVKDECKAQLLKSTIGLVALRVDAKAPPPQVVWASGKIDNIRPDVMTFDLKVETRDGDLAVVKTISFVSTNTTKILKNGQPAKFADLKAGDIAKVAYVVPPPSLLPVIKPIPALAIDARTPPQPIVRVTGRIVSMGNMGIVIEPADSAIVAPRLAFTVTPNTKIDKFGPAGFDALMVGDAVTVTYYQVPPAATVIPTALSIVVLPNLYKGTVMAVDPLRGTVTLQASPTGPAMLFKVVDRTVIVKNGIKVPLKALVPKDIAEVRFFRFRLANVAAEIVAKAPLR